MRLPANKTTRMGSLEPDDSQSFTVWSPNIFCEHNIFFIHLMKTQAQNGTRCKQFNILGKKKKRSGTCGRTTVVCECTAISMTRLSLQARETVMWTGPRGRLAVCSLSFHILLDRITITVVAFTCRCTGLQKLYSRYRKKGLNLHFHTSELVHPYIFTHMAFNRETSHNDDGCLIWSNETRWPAACLKETVGD